MLINFQCSRTVVKKNVFGVITLRSWQSEIKKIDKKVYGGKNISVLINNYP